MGKRYVVIWFRYLRTDWIARRNPFLHKAPFVLASPDHGRMLVSAVNAQAGALGIWAGMTVADARTIISSLHVFDDNPAISQKLLNGFAQWCIRYTPVAGIHLPDSLILDVSGCTHLWGSEERYLTEIINRISGFGYTVYAAMADTIGAAWAIAHFSFHPFIIEPPGEIDTLLSLPPTALRLEPEVAERLQKLGIRQIKNFITMPRPVLQRRFGEQFIKKLRQSIGEEDEFIIPVQPPEPFQERLPCLEPIVTRPGIEIALRRLLERLCCRLQREAKGLRAALFKAYRIDGKLEKIEISTTRPSHNATHLFKLFSLKITNIEPALGIELFVLEALKVEDASPAQQKLWDNISGLDNPGLAELIDRLAGKIGQDQIHRYLPDEHYWPERSVKPALSLNEKLATTWKTDRPRPLQLLSSPERIDVTAPVPDYPPMNFRYKGKLHKIIKADGPERIEQEWWLEQGQHRDYYHVEDEEGKRYWLFRSGHYDDKSYQWFIHGFFA